MTERDRASISHVMKLTPCLIVYLFAFQSDQALKTDYVAYKKLLENNSIGMKQNILVLQLIR